jgi:hypothetical protein
MLSVLVGFEIYLRSMGALNFYIRVFFLMEQHMAVI